MRRLVARGGAPVIIETSPPSCGPGDVLVETLASTVSVGTEMSILRRSADVSGPDVEYPGEPPYTRPAIRQWMRASPEPEPPIPGHLSLGYSLAGRVTAVGSDVPDIAEGDLVACAGSQCSHHAEVVAVPRTLTVPVPAGLAPDVAAFVTPGAVAVEAVRRTECRFGETVVIYGLGLLGNLAAQVARSAGLYVIGVEVDGGRRALARSLGFGDVLNPASADTVEAVRASTEGFGADAVVLSLVSDSSEPLNEAFDLCRQRGRVVGLGVFGMTLERGRIFDRTYVQAIAFGPGRYDPLYEEGNVDYPIGYVRWTENRNMAHFLRLAAEGKITVEGFAETFPLQDAPAAYGRLSDHDRPLTIQFDYGP